MQALTPKCFLRIDDSNRLAKFSSPKRGGVPGWAATNDQNIDILAELTDNHNNYTANLIGCSRSLIKCSINGISKDNLISHLKFKEKYGVKFDLLADEKKEAIKSYKIWGKKKFLGVEFMGIIRSTFLIKGNKIIKEWRSVKVKDHAKEVLNFLSNLK